MSEQPGTNLAKREKPIEYPVISGLWQGGYVIPVPGGSPETVVVSPGDALYEAFVDKDSPSKRFILTPPGIEPGDVIDGIVVSVESDIAPDQEHQAVRLLAKYRVTTEIAASAQGFRGEIWESEPSTSPPEEIVAELRERVSKAAIPDEAKKIMCDVTDPDEFLKYVGLYSVDDGGNNQIFLPAMFSLDAAERARAVSNAFKAKEKELAASTPDGELKLKLENADLPEKVRKRVDKEFKRLQRMSENSSDRTTLEHWLTVIAELPWGQGGSAPSKPIEEIWQTLEAALAGRQKQVGQVVEYIDLWKRRHEQRANMTPEEREKASDKGVYALGLEGPPGTGKTTIGRQIARAMDREFVSFDFGGTHSVSDVKGMKRSYKDALMGKIIQAIHEHGSNLVIFLEEIDKTSKDRGNGNPYAVLNEILDPSRSSEFTDLWLDIPFDISDVVFVTSYNEVGQLPNYIRDRLYEINFGGYTKREKLEIAKSHVVPAAYESAGANTSEVVLPEESLEYVIEDYISGAGLRELDKKLIRAIGAAKTAIRTAEEKGEPLELPVVIDREMVTESLGDPYRENEVPVEWDIDGAGLAMLVSGGLNGSVGIWQVTELASKGGEVKTVGNVKEGIAETAAAAYSWVQDHREVLGIAEDAFEHDLQLFTGDISVPKDGPSAGAITTVLLASKLMKTPVASKLAMTGTIEPLNRVGLVGGVQAKVTGAYEQGVETVLVPQGNLSDVEKLPKEVQEGVNVIGITRIEEAIVHAFPGKFTFDGKKLERVPDQSAPPTAEPIRVSARTAAAEGVA